MNDLTHSHESAAQPESQESILAPSVAPNLAAAAPASNAVKKLSYHSRLKLMSDRQLQGELRRAKRNQKTPRINEIFAVVLSTVFENHLKGMNPYIR